MLNVGTARLKAGKNEEIRDLLQAAEQSIQQAKGITQQLLTFTRGGEPVKTSMALQPMIKESVKFTLHGSKAKSRFDLPDDLWPVEIDPGQINQVINNLALNAVQAMSRGGHLTVTARNVTIEEGDQRTTALQPGNYVEVAIKDEGVGIPPENIDSIFDPYYTTREKGTGLGLFSVYSIIERHGGWITVESEVDLGTTFTFYLPAAADEEAAAISSEIKEGSGRVLVMDDDDTICLGLKALLGELGYEVETTANGEEAIERYGEALKSDQPFDAVIMDLTVPGGMGGAEAIGHLKELDPRVRAVVSSGYSTDPIMANYQEYGFEAVLMKPFQLADLSRAMDLVLG
ncbi:MAG: response regulator, partial [Calditrichaeota bacterium]|nr:response regulator [Calditrichota bacterium]